MRMNLNPAKPSEATFASVVANNPNGIIIADSRGRCAYANDAACRLLGYGPGELSGRSLFDLISGDDVARLIESRTRMVHGARETAEWRLRHRDGHWVRVEASARICSGGPWCVFLHDIAHQSALAACSGGDEWRRLQGMLAAGDEIAALRKALEEARAALRDREELLAVVAHDLRSPLTGIVVCASTAEIESAKLPGGEVVRALAASVLESAAKLSGLVEDLLSAAVSGGGRPAIKMSAAIPAHDLLTAASRAAKPLFARDGIRLELQLAAPLPVVCVDRERILRVVTNLLDNARKYTRAPGSVVLRAERASGGVRCCVANSGTPLSPEEMREMFQPFWQAGRNEGGGVGLGLSISRSIVEAHGGQIWAEPAEGQRVRMCFSLPSAAPDCCA